MKAFYITLLLAACGGETKEIHHDGLPGEKGPPGLPGIDGPQGNSGDRGPQGPRGLTGPQGLQGPPGLRGERGPVGPQGLQGDPGPSGLQGRIGPKGDKGDTGAQGPRGFAGAIGPKGEAGAIGPTGPKGDAGPRGPKGDAGPRGPKGDGFNAQSCKPMVEYRFENDCHFLVRSIPNSSCTNYSPDSFYWILGESRQWQPMITHEYQTVNFAGEEVKCLKKITEKNIFNGREKVTHFKANCGRRL